MSEKKNGPANGAQAEKHVPVLLHETLDLLDIRPGLTYVDATAGNGGHLRGILQRAGLSSENRAAVDTHGIGETVESRSPLQVIGIDRDVNAIAELRKMESEHNGALRICHANFADIKSVLNDIGASTITGGIMADLGVSSMQLDQPERGFSFLREGPLDMRMDATQTTTAEDLVNDSSEEELADIIYNYGEERFSRQIAREIVRCRPLRTTSQLAEVVSRSLHYQKKRIGGKSRNRSGAKDSSHPATRTFQAIRIAVNNELGSLEKFLADATAILAPGARLVVITFHSLEDRVVKQFLRQRAAECVCPPRMPVCTCHHKRELLIITRKPIVADEKEVLANIRSRSAKLRAGQKL